MATHSSVLAWRFPWKGEPGGRPSMGSHTVGHDWSDLAAAADSILKSRDSTLPTKVHLVKAMVFPVVMYGCDSWTIKKAEHRRTDAFELWCCRRLLKSPWDCKEIKPVHPKGDESWVFIGRTDAEVETPPFWPPDAKNWLLEKDLMLGKIEGRSRRGCLGSLPSWTWLWASSGRWWWRSLACGSPWGHKELDTTERLNWSDVLQLNF